MSAPSFYARLAASGQQLRPNATAYRKGAPNLPADVHSRHHRTWLSPRWAGDPLDSSPIHFTARRTIFGWLLLWQPGLPQGTKKVLVILRFLERREKIGRRD